MNHPYSSNIWPGVVSTRTKHIILETLDLIVCLVPTPGSDFVILLEQNQNDLLLLGVD